MSTVSQALGKQTAQSTKKAIKEAKYGIKSSKFD